MASEPSGPALDESGRSSLPLAELHCHLEGTVSPDVARELAARHGIDLSRVIDGSGNYVWGSFTEFLDVYVAVCEAIRTAEDYHDITRAYYSAMAEKGLVYGEVFVSPDLGRDRGLSYRTLIDAVAAAMEEVEARHGVTARIVLTAIRHLGVEAAEAVARCAERAPHPYVVGFGMAGEEGFGAPGDFRTAFEIAGGAGLRLTAHAGELMGAESVRQTLHALPVERIGHGVRAVEDDAVLAELIERGITLEICPSSNLALRLYPDVAAHPVGRLVERGAAVTLSSDDPPYFHTDIAREYALVARAHGFSDRDMLGFTRRSILAAFCDDNTKTRLLARVDGALASGSGGGM